MVVCLSTAPSVSLYRWVTEDPWQYLYTVWAGALLGAGLFVLHVLAPIVDGPLVRSGGSSSPWQLRWHWPCGR